MSQILPCVVVVISLYMHACSARHLIITSSPFHNQATQMAHESFPQVGASSDHATISNSGSEDEAETQAADGTFLGAIKHSLFRPSFIEVTAGNNEAAGGQVLFGQQQEENIVPDQGLMRKTWRRGRALMVENVKKKTVKEKESNVGEDDDDDQSKESTSAEEDSNSVDMMDYAQPHRKPPIHNEKH